MRCTQPPIKPSRRIEGLVRRWVSLVVRRLRALVRKNKPPHYDNIRKEEAPDIQHDSLAHCDGIASWPFLRPRIHEIPMAGHCSAIAPRSDAGFQQHVVQSNRGHHGRFESEMSTPPNHALQRL